MQQDSSLADALKDWAALQGIGKKPRTQTYHAETVAALKRHWPLKCDAAVTTITEPDVPTAARWLGHQDGGALLGRTYFHLVDHHSRRMAARVRL